MNQPLYEKIYQDLKAKIISGQLDIGQQLPTESELSSLYNVSRITSKRALTELENEGLISRTRGKGSFVKEILFDLPPISDTHRILFLLPFNNDASLGNFNAGLLPVLETKNYQLFLTNTDFLINRQAQSIQQEFAGMIFYADQFEEYIDILFELYKENFPIIVLDKKISDFELPTILSDNYSGGKLATEVLVANHHSKIGYIFSDSNRPQSTRQRYLGYLSVLKEKQLDFHTSLTDTLATLDSIVDYVTKHELTAVICENDLTAIQAMKKLKEANYAIPNDLSIIGFDDIQAAQFVEPALSTVSQNFEEIGRLAGTSLLEWITTGVCPKDQFVPVSLISRQTIKQFEME